MPEKFKKLIGLLILVFVVGGVSCSALVNSIYTGQTGNAVEISK